MLVSRSRFFGFGNTNERVSRNQLLRSLKIISFLMASLEKSERICFVHFYRPGSSLLAHWLLVSGSNPDLRSA